MPFLSSCGNAMPRHCVKKGYDPGFSTRKVEGLQVPNQVLPTNEETEKNQFPLNDTSFLEPLNLPGWVYCVITSFYTVAGHSTATLFSTSWTGVMRGSAACHSGWVDEMSVWSPGNILPINSEGSSGGTPCQGSKLWCHTQPHLRWKRLHSLRSWNPLSWAVHVLALCWWNSATLPWASLSQRRKHIYQF